MPPLLFFLRLRGYLFPCFLLAVAAYAAFLVLLEVVTFRGTTDILRPERLRERIFGKLWLRINASTKEREEDSILPELEKKAYGNVLEIGPGSGNQLSRYDKSNITRIYGVEPNPELHEALRKTIKAEGLDDIYIIVPCGIEDFRQLKEYGVEAGKIDTIVSASALCSVPRPEEVTRALYKLLKPGGQMIVFEHVASSDPITRVVQMIYDIVWPYAAGGCNLQRYTGQYIAMAGKWQKVELESPKVEDAALIVPHLCGLYIKSSAPE